MSAPRIALSAPDLSVAETRRVAQAMRQGWISGTGGFVAEFETGVAARVGRLHAVAVTNGTLAIELALRALDIGPGDEVIVPALTFAAPAMSALAVGANVVLADVSPTTWTLDPAMVALLITAQTKAIIAVDVFGHPADHDALAALGPPVVQDAAQAHGAFYKGRPVGSQGQVSTFSFHANKAITTGEGGAVCTDDDELAATMRLIAHHGMSPDEPYVHRVLGRNFRMPNLMAAIGVGQVERWDELVAARIRVADRYREYLPPELAGPSVAEWARPSCWLHPIRVPHRDALLDGIRAAGIDARPIWPALDRQPALRHLRGQFPVAHAICDTAIMLPTHARLSDDEIRYVAETVRAVADDIDEEA